MHFLTVILQLKTRYRKIMPFVLAVVAKSCSLRGDLPCWMLFYFSTLSSNTVILHKMVMDQTIVPACEVHVGCPLNSAPEYWRYRHTLSAQHIFQTLKIFTWQISQCSGCISCTRTMNFLQCRLQQSTSQILQCSKEIFSLKNEGFLS